MITTNDAKRLLSVLKAAEAVDLPAAVSELGSDGGWVYVKEYEKYGKQVQKLYAAVKRARRAPPKRKKA